MCYVVLCVIVPRCPFGLLVASRFDESGESGDVPMTSSMLLVRSRNRLAGKQKIGVLWQGCRGADGAAAGGSKTYIVSSTRGATNTYRKLHHMHCTTIAIRVTRDMQIHVIVLQDA